MPYNRVFPRLSLACDIEFTIEKKNTDSNGEIVASRTKDISEGGICLITYTPLNKGDILNLKFRLQGSDKVFTVTGKVAWTESFSIGAMKGYDNGIEFIEIADKDKVDIERFIEKMFKI